LDSNCSIGESGQTKPNIQDRRDTIQDRRDTIQNRRDRIPNSSPTAHFTLATAQKLRMKDEQKFLYMKKQKLNDGL